MRVARQARNEKNKYLFQVFRQGENEVLIASKARWDEQLKGLIMLERRCLTLKEEVEHLSERQEVLTDLMESNINMQKTAPEKYQEKIFEELEVEEQIAKKAPALVQRKHKLIKWEGERERAKDHAIGPWSRGHDNFILRFLLFPSFQHRRTNVCFLQDGVRRG